MFLFLKIEKAIEYCSIALDYVLNYGSHRATLLEGQTGVFLMQYLLGEKQLALQNVQNFLLQHQFDCDEMLYGRAGVIVKIRKRKNKYIYILVWFLNFKFLFLSKKASLIVMNEKHELIEQLKNQMLKKGLLNK